MGDSNFYITGIRPGEKLHEIMIPKEEARLCIDMEKYFIIKPVFKWWNSNKLDAKLSKGKLVDKDFEYISSNKTLLMNDSEIKNFLGDLD